MFHVGLGAKPAGSARLVVDDDGFDVLTLYDLIRSGVEIIP